MNFYCENRAEIIFLKPVIHISINKKLKPHRVNLVNDYYALTLIEVFYI